MVCGEFIDSSRGGTTRVVQLCCNVAAHVCEIKHFEISVDSSVVGDGTHRSVEGDDGQ